MAFLTGNPSAQFGSISTAASGATSLVAAVAGKRIKVIGFTIVSTGANAVKFQSAANDKTGAMALAANGALSESAGNGTLFQTNAGEALNINLSAATQVSGFFQYIVEGD